MWLPVYMSVNKEIKSITITSMPCQAHQLVVRRKAWKPDSATDYGPCSCLATHGSSTLSCRHYMYELSFHFSRMWEVTMTHCNKVNSLTRWSATKSTLSLALFPASLHGTNSIKSHEVKLSLRLTLTRESHIIQCFDNHCLSLPPYFRMGAYKHDVVVVIKMGAYIHGVLILCGCLLSWFYGNLALSGFLVGSCTNGKSFKIKNFSNVLRSRSSRKNVIYPNKPMIQSSTRNSILGIYGWIQLSTRATK